MRKPVLSFAALACVLASAALAADTRVYRCQDSGRVVYSDAPCANAEVVEIEAGSAAPDASERLRRDQQALDARAAQRREARAREEALERMNAARPAPAEEPPPQPTYYADAPGYGYGVWTPQKPRNRDRHERERRRRDTHIVVKPPPHPSLPR